MPYSTDKIGRVRKGAGTLMFFYPMYCIQGAYTGQKDVCAPMWRASELEARR